jgi:hypothetical protein
MAAEMICIGTEGNRYDSDPALVEVLPVLYHEFNKLKKNAIFKELVDIGKNPEMV